ncbi:unnamed protein product [Ectocarpus sp. CCAP 1310/34]|nr:unnamed protein product [Ectocarpus sp. CCAP 1310/34]
MGETISDRRFKDICVQGFSEDYKDIKMVVFRDPSFGVQQVQATMRNNFLDEQMRKRTKGQIAGRGFTMATKTSGPICFECNEPGHVRRNCPVRGAQKATAAEASENPRGRNNGRSSGPMRWGLWVEK